MSINVIHCLGLVTQDMRRCDLIGCDKVGILVKMMIMFTFMFCVYRINSLAFLWDIDKNDH